MHFRFRRGLAVMGVGALLFLTACETETTVGIGSDGQPTSLGYHVELPKAAAGILGIGSLEDFENTIRSASAEDGGEIPPEAEVSFSEDNASYILDASAPSDAVTVDQLLSSLPDNDKTPWSYEASADGEVQVTLTRTSAPSAAPENPLGEGFEVQQFLTLEMPGPIQSANSDGPAPVIDGSTVRFRIDKLTTTLSASAATSSTGLLVTVLVVGGLIALIVVIGVLIAIAIRRGKRRSPDSIPAGGQESTAAGPAPPS